MNIEEKTKKIICDIIENHDCISEIQYDTNLMRDTGMDSIQMMRLVVEVENEFDFELDDDDLDMSLLSDFKNLVSIINKHKTIKHEE